MTIHEDIRDREFITFGVVLIVWEVLPTFMVVWFFRVRKPNVGDMVSGLKLGCVLVPRTHPNFFSVSVYSQEFLRFRRVKTVDWPPLQDLSEVLDLVVAHHVFVFECYVIQNILPNSLPNL